MGISPRNAGENWSEMRKVLDSWALIAWILGEQSAARKLRMMLLAAEAGDLTLTMSMLNVGEVYYLLAKRRGQNEAETFIADFAAMPIQARVPTASSIMGAARLKGRFTISYADAFAIQAAIEENAPLVSGDPEIRAVAETGIVDLEWVR